MAVLSIVKYPDPRLRQKAERVREITPRIQALLDDMLETMYAASGIGLAANQVGSRDSLLVMDLREDEETEQERTVYKLINPEICSRDGNIIYEEGCLSIPGVREKVHRSETVCVKALNELGEEIEIKASGLMAICLQHEIDHLNGILFIDHLSSVKREMLKSKLAKLQKS